MRSAPQIDYHSNDGRLTSHLPHFRSRDLMPRKCTVFGCRSGYKPTSNQNSQIKFYRFPKDEESLRLWIKNLLNRFPPNISPSSNQVVCSLHCRENRALAQLRFNNEFLRTLQPSSLMFLPVAFLILPRLVRRRQDYLLKRDPRSPTNYVSSKKWTNFP